jgi:hypothetical protein
VSLRNSLFPLLLAPLLLAAADQPARQSPPFAIQRPGAAPLTLSQFRGKIVALAFIQTTCPHCQELTRTLNAVSRDYTPRGVQFLECAFDAGAQRGLPLFTRLFQPTFPVGWADQAAVMSYLQYSVLLPLYVPHMVFLDKQGVIRGDYAGESAFFRTPEANIRAELDKLLKPASEPRKRPTSSARPLRP